MNKTQYNISLIGHAEKLRNNCFNIASGCGIVGYTHSIYANADFLCSTQAAATTPLLFLKGSEWGCWGE